jgi:hypothetical protein
MHSMQLAKIRLKSVNFKGLKGTRTQKIRIFVTANCFGIFADFKSRFWPYFKNIILSKCCMRILFNQILFLIFFLKNSLCIYVNLRICFLFLKTCWGPHFFSYTHNFFLKFSKTLNKKPWDFGKDMWILTLDISFRSFAKKTVFWDSGPKFLPRCVNLTIFLHFSSF